MIKSAIYDPAHEGNVEAVRNYLDQNPGELNATVAEGFNLLQIACSFGHVPLVAYLLDRRALVNKNAENISKTTALHLAVSFRDEKLALELAQLLMANGAELNGAQVGGQTPLHHAVDRGSVALVEALIDCGADPFLKDDQGRSPNDLVKSADNAELKAVLKGAFDQVGQTTT